MYRSADRAQTVETHWGPKNSPRLIDQQLLHMHSKVKLKNTIYGVSMKKKKHNRVQAIDISDDYEGVRARGRVAEMTADQLVRAPLHDRSLLCMDQQVK